MASNKRDPMGADLLRQRRNLMVVSLALAAVQLAGASFESAISILGASITIKHPDRLLIGAWVLWTYFLLRYVQYLQEEPNWGFREKIEMWILRHYGDLTENANFQKVEWRSWWRWQLLEALGDPSEERDWGWMAPRSPSVVGLSTLRAFISVAVRTPRFTDYVLPVLVALFPLFLKVCEFAVPLVEWLRKSFH